MTGMLSQADKQDSAVDGFATAELRERMNTGCVTTQAALTTPASAGWSIS